LCTLKKTKISKKITKNLQGEISKIVLKNLAIIILGILFALKINNNTVEPKSVQIMNVPVRNKEKSHVVNAM